MHGIYEQIAQRTGGNVYLSVVGPVRTGKSTFIKCFMETLVLPHMEDVYRRERARDELPQSGSGRTIMTSEPKFVPEEAVEISPDGVSRLSVRLIDCVGYMVDGAMGATEDGTPRMVTTPWVDHEIPLTEAAELGTKKVMEDHCVLGIVMTTDGSITDIPRSDYREAERRSIADMQATGKPFVVLVNSTNPEGAAAKQLAAELAQTYGVACQTVNCLAMDEAKICGILSGVLQEFPMEELRVYLPGWVDALPADHPIKTALYDAMRSSACDIGKLSEAEPAIRQVSQLDSVSGYTLREIDLGTGTVSAALEFPEELFYEVLGQQTGLEIHDDGELMALLGQMAQIKREYEKVETALQQVKATGYGIVMPDTEEMELEMPEIVHKGGSYGVKLRASAPSIHMLRADIRTEISPMVGDQRQSEELANYLLGAYEEDPARLWESNLFGRTVFDLVSEGLNTKLVRLPDTTRMKLKNAVGRIVNEESNGLICILI